MGSGTAEAASSGKRGGGVLPRSAGRGAVHSFAPAAQAVLRAAAEGSSGRGGRRALGDPAAVLSGRRPLRAPRGHEGHDQAGSESGLRFASAGSDVGGIGPRRPDESGIVASFEGVGGRVLRRGGAVVRVYGGNRRVRPSRFPESTRAAGPSSPASAGGRASGNHHPSRSPSSSRYPSPNRTGARRARQHRGRRSCR